MDAQSQVSLSYLSIPESLINKCCVILRGKLSGQVYFSSSLYYGLPFLLKLMSVPTLYSKVALCLCPTCSRQLLTNPQLWAQKIWAFCHIVSLPTRPPAAHQEEEIRTIPFFHCSDTRIHTEDKRVNTFKALFHVTKYLP